MFRYIVYLKSLPPEKQVNVMLSSEWCWAAVQLARLGYINMIKLNLVTTTVLYRVRMDETQTKHAVPLAQPTLEIRKIWNKWHQY